MGGLPKSATTVHGGGDMKLKDYVLRWQEVYDKTRAARPHMQLMVISSKTTFSPDWEYTTL